MKNILIIGSPRVGKTNLAKKISSELNYVYLGLDDIFLSIEKLKCWPYPKYYDASVISKELADFVISYLSSLDKEHNYVIEGAYIDILDIYNKIDDINYIGLTYNDLDKESLFSRIKKYDNNSWLSNFTDDIILEKCDCFIKRNKYYNECFKELNIKTYDLSKDYLIMMNKIVEDIRRSL